MHTYGEPTAKKLLVALRPFTSSSTIMNNLSAFLFGKQFLCSVLVVGLRYIKGTVQRDLRGVKSGINR